MLVQGPTLPLCYFKGASIHWWQTLITANSHIYCATQKLQKYWDEKERIVLSEHLANMKQTQPPVHCRPLCPIQSTGTQVRLKHFNVQEAEQCTADKQQKIYVLPVLGTPQVTRNWSVKAHVDSFQQMIHAPCHKGSENLANLIWWKIPSWPQSGSPFDG